MQSPAEAKCTIHNHVLRMMAMGGRRVEGMCSKRHDNVNRIDVKDPHTLIKKTNLLERWQHAVQACTHSRRH